MRRPLVAGNWKMNGTRESVRALADAVRAGIDGLDGVDVAVCPSFVHIPVVAAILEGSALRLGAQTVADQAEGAVGGEVSGAMQREFGCTLALVGHSVRRQLYAASDVLVARLLTATLPHSLEPVLCVGS